MATLNHAGLATIYGVEIWRGTPVLVVEYLAGGTLSARLARGPLPRDEIIAIGLAIADALAYMHRRGVLHRDLKPSNIGLTADGAVKLLDFGLSPDAHRAGGTAAYLPPEVLAGAAADVDVDLWGLARVLHEAGGDRDPAFAAFFRRAFAAAPDDRFRSAAALRAAVVRLRRRARRGQF